MKDDDNVFRTAKEDDLIVNRGNQWLIILIVNLKNQWFLDT
jgi:hypothetical protein